MRQEDHGASKHTSRGPRQEWVNDSPCRQQAREGLDCSLVSAPVNTGSGDDPERCRSCQSSTSPQKGLELEALGRRRHPLCSPSRASQAAWQGVLLGTHVSSFVFSSRSHLVQERDYALYAHHHQDACPNTRQCLRNEKPICSLFKLDAF